MRQPQPLRISSSPCSFSLICLGSGFLCRRCTDVGSDLLMEACVETGENETLNLICIPILSGEARYFMEFL